MWIVLVAVVLGSGYAEEWNCPDIRSEVSCSCYAQRTMICRGEDVGSLLRIANLLRGLTRPESVSLLDSTLHTLKALPSNIFQEVLLDGLVISSGDLSRVDSGSFEGLQEVLEVLGLPNNRLSEVPSPALSRLNALIRLDLSHNRIQALRNPSFTGMPKLRFLDLSGNQITSVDPRAFSELSELEELDLQENRIRVETVDKLEGLLNLERLDLSNNSIAGPLSPLMIPKLPRLKSLNLAHNQITSILKGALKSLESLQDLSLEHNMIDVLEDHSFNALTRLNNLNLAHNGIVAISEASLAHLSDLVKLDVSHNFLRALTPDLISPLSSLRELALDDNDISMVSKDALVSAIHLRRLTLAENPLNCDCSLAEFAKWLQNSRIEEKDKRTSICATPPHLENGLVQDLRLAEFVCDHEENIPAGKDKYRIPVSGMRIALQAINYDGKNISLLWSIDSNRSYTCDSLVVYKELGTHQVLLETDQLHCNSSTFRHPRALPLILKAPHLRTGNRYRYCLILVEETSSNESSLVVGCSEVLTLSRKESARVLSLRAHFLDPHILSITPDIWPNNFSLWHECIIKYEIHISPSFVIRKRANCSDPNTRIESIKEPGPYNVCAIAFESPPFCKLAQMNYGETTFSNPSVSLLLFCLTITLLVVALVPIYRWMKKIFNQPKIHEQYFLPSPQNEQKNSKYVKLQATTKL